MRFMSIMFGLLCLPLLMVGIMLSPVITPALFLLAAGVPGFAAFKGTSDKRCWNIASFHSPHSLTWRWLVGLSIERMFSRPCIHFHRGRGRFEPSPFVSFLFNIGIGGAHASTNNNGWQFAAWLLGVHVRFSQQRPMWYRDLYHRARDEADQLSGLAWFSDKHPNKVHVPPRPTAAMPATMQ